MIINGKEYQFKDITIKEVLKEFNLNEEKVVVEVNFEIIPKEQYGNFILKQNDSLEVISFVGGG
ncbi:thiamine biosynthesis protein ThiS [Clostridium polyendosporum]|uniref:Thiamine biosynthesis protein ThiS n=1 Tax=Clostridium polyendosporum TaxID=69208 RepID=A0A919S1I6_9CLOT|nr:sulfur carrier protein ThiS [Clostridium polyendosporum]GIM28898.1 thiamine biosynthesis protein ThiS [Clostridium polyendosporum]